MVSIIPFGDRGGTGHPVCRSACHSSPRWFPCGAAVRATFRNSIWEEYDLLFACHPVQPADRARRAIERPAVCLAPSTRFIEEGWAHPAAGIGDSTAHFGRPRVLQPIADPRPFRLDRGLRSSRRRHRRRRCRCLCCWVCSSRRRPSYITSGDCRARDRREAAAAVAARFALLSSSRRACAVVIADVAAARCHGDRTDCTPQPSRVAGVVNCCCARENFTHAGYEAVPVEFMAAVQSPLASNAAAAAAAAAMVAIVVVGGSEIATQRRWTATCGRTPASYWRRRGESYSGKA